MLVRLSSDLKKSPENEEKQGVSAIFAFISLLIKGFKIYWGEYI